MKSPILSEKHFHDEAAAYAFVEARLWPNGPVCPLCRGTERISAMKGASTRIGAYKCYACRKPFTVKVGTIFESSHVPMRIWLQAIYLIAGSKKGFSTNQLHRTLGVTLKTAWFMSHRIREAMKPGNLPPMGGEGETVEVDETYIGRKKGAPVRNAYHHKMAVLSIVDRRTGEVRSKHVSKPHPEVLIPEVLRQVDRRTYFVTDDAVAYRHYLGHQVAKHESVKHQRGEYVRGDVHTNTIEGFFSIFKRGMRGIYQHCGERHLNRYLAEFDFRYTNRIATGYGDVERADKALLGVVGKRLTYKTVARTLGG